MAKRRTKWKTRVKRAWRTHRTRVRREREKARVQAAKGNLAGKGGSKGSAKRAPDRFERLQVLVHQKVAAYRADADEVELSEERHRNALRRIDRRHRFVCGAHTPALRFASAMDLNAHFAAEHAEPVRHPRGKVADKVHANRPLPPTPVHRRPTGKPSAGKRAKVPAAAVDARELQTKLRLVELHMGKIRQEAVEHMGAADGVATLGDIGSMPITTVSQIREAMVALEAIAGALQEAVTGFQQNARTSEQAPIKEEVLVHLNPAVDGAQQVATATVAFLSAFDDEYEPDIRDAKAGERMDNTALTR